MTGGEGGIVLTGHAETADQLRLLRNHGQCRTYEHALIGYNWRLTEMQAAIGRVQLRAHRIRSITRRSRGSSAVPSRPIGLVHTGRDAVLSFLLGRGIEARIYFPPAHRQPIFAHQHGQLPVTEQAAAKMLSIPMHSRLTPEELAEIADTVEEAVGRVRAAQ